MINNGMSNVIPFPKKKKEESSVTVDLEYLDFLTDELTQDIAEFLHDDGFDVGNENYIFEVSMLYESIKSLLYKMSNVYHPMQKFANNVYSPFYDTTTGEEIDTPEQLEFDFGDLS